MTDYASFALSGQPITLGRNAHNAALADNGNILVMSSEVMTYSGTSYRSGHLVAQLYDHAGQPVGEKVGVASRSLYYASESGPGASDVDALTGGGFVATFHASPQSGSPGSEVWIAVFSPSGALLKTMQLGSAYGGADISVDPLGNGGFVAVATSAGKYDYGRSYVQTFDASGAPTSESLPLGTAGDVLVTGVGESGYLAVYGKLRYFDGAAFKDEVPLPSGVLVAAGDTLTTGKVVLLSTRYDGTEYDLYSLTFDPATNTLSAPTLIHSEAKAMSAVAVEATPGGGYVVSWGTETYTDGARVAFTVGPSGAKSDLFIFEGTLLGAFGPTDSVVSTLAFNSGTPKLQDYAIGPGEAPAQTLRADNSAGERLTGGAGDDVFHAGQGSAVLTGQGGGDLFVFDALPWNAGKITDFTVGADKLDFSKLFSAAGYTGSDPIADGRVFFQSDAAGTRVYFDGDGSGSAQSPFLITLLEGVSGALAWSKIGGTSAGGPPGPPPPNTQIGLTNIDVYKQEGHSGVTPFVYNVSRTGDTSGASSVTWNVSPWTNTLTADDFENGVYPSGTLTFAPGETSKQIIVNVRGDTAVEHDEQFNVALTGVTGAVLGISNGKGYISNDDVYQEPPSQIRFTNTQVSNPEGDQGLTAFTFTVARSGSANVAATVDWGVSGTGPNPALPTDFENGAYPSGTVRFAVGEATKTITVQVAGDTALENNETFSVTLTNPVGAALGANHASGLITNDDAAPPDGGQVINSPGPGSTLQGGAGNDTLNGSQGPDVLTGGGGDDVFRWAFQTWAPARVTDFTLGSDQLDLSNLFRLQGYTGADPVADKWIWLIDDGAGGTKVLFDSDGAGPNPQWPNYILQLERVPVEGLTWSQLTTGGGSSEPPPPPPGDGEVITSPGPGSTLTGTAGADTITSSRGQDVLTGAGGADHFVFASENWAPARITDFEDGIDKIDIRGMLDAVGYTGTDPFGAGYLRLIDDGAGGTKVLFDRDAGGPEPQWPNYVFQVEKVAPSALGASDWIFQ